MPVRRLLAMVKLVWRDRPSVMLEMLPPVPP
jgi:hypothetical protein